MDNPHVLETELAYLAGIIDGEGTITLERAGKRRLNGVMGLTPQVIIANTDEALIQYVINIVKKLGAKPYVKTQCRNYGKIKRQKHCYWVQVKGLVKAAKVLRSILPYLIAKSAQARLLLDFIGYRGESQQAKGRPYGEYELNILEKIRALNFRGTSETEDRGIRHFVV